MSERSLAGYRIALFMCAAHCQGGHSDAGRVAAEVLNVPFPIRMEDLARQAKAEGFDPKQLWPWLKGSTLSATDGSSAGSPSLGKGT